MKLTLCLVGGGAASIAFLYNHIKNIGSDSSISYTVYVVEKRPECGPGAAYCDDLDSNLLNTKTGYISAFLDRPGDFYQWLQENVDLWKWKYPNFDLDPNSYAPRPLFGLYLQYAFRSVVNYALSKGVNVIQVNAEATRAYRLKDSCIISTKCGIEIRADYLFLLCGTLENLPGDSPKSANGMIHNPYPVSKLANWMPKDKSIAIIGARLSAIDAVIALMDSGHTGKVTIYSRSGYFPFVRGTQERFYSTRFTKEYLNDLYNEKGSLTLSDLAAMVSADLHDFDKENTDHSFERLSIPSPITDLRTFLADEIMLSHQPRAWQAILYATNPVVHTIWQYLDPADQRLFKEKYASAFISARVSIPRENAEKILSYIDDGRLHFVPSFDHAAKLDDGSVVIHHTEGGTKETRDYDYAIWATGFPKDLRKSGSTLLKNMLHNGDISRHPDGGIAIDSDTYRVIRDDYLPDNRVFAVGEITSGQFFFTSAMDIIYRHAQHCAGAFLKIVHSSQNGIRIPEEASYSSINVNKPPLDSASPLLVRQD